MEWNLKLALAPAMAALALGCSDEPRADEGDGGAPEAGIEDAGPSVDAPEPDAEPRCSDAGTELPEDLFCTGLYAAEVVGALGEGVRPYEPALTFWSDGADKSRFLYRPAGATIDATDAGEWIFPVGTKAWKEFRLDDARIETRILWKRGIGDWVSAAYRWDGTGTRASRMRAGERVPGTTYDIPGPDDCLRCHGGRQDRLLGVEALSLGLPGATGITLAGLAAEGRLTPPPAVTAFAFADGPDGPAGAALGWLHANCGTACHNPSNEAEAYYSGFYARLSVTKADGGIFQLDETETYETAIGRTPVSGGYEGFQRVFAGDPEKSLVYRFAMARQDSTMRTMPPLATNLSDPLGKKLLETWISGL